MPAGTKLAAKPEAIKDWNALSADEKKLFARQMEVYAGFGEYTDAEDRAATGPRSRRRFSPRLPRTSGLYR